MGAGPDPDRGAVSNHRRSRFDVRVVPHRRRSALRLRDWRMGTKLATVLVIPTVAFLVLAGVQTRGLVGQTTTLSDFAQQVGIGRQITEAVDRLQRERDRTAGELAALHGSAGGAERDAAIAALKPLQTASDQALADLRGAAEPLADADAAWRVGYSEVLEAYDQVIYIRAAVPPAVLSSDTILSNYHRAIGALLALLAQPSPGDDQRVLTDAVLRYVQLSRVKELSSRIRAELYAAARAGRYAADDQVALADLRTQQLTALGAFRVVATADQVRRYDQTSEDPGFVAATKLEETTLPGTAAEPAVLLAPAWWMVSERRQDLLHRLENEVLNDAVRRADAASSGQLRDTLLVVGGIGAVLLVAVLISLLIGRSIARSMRLLRSQALRIAQVELPDALDRLRAVDSPVTGIDVPPAVVRSLDEIGELAEAFVAVHRSAVSVAVEQALMRRNVNAMFVNLARRSQVLVERQLELLDDLEREESDPEQLENLFKLDHLAARMRRNDESLLVLAGTESTRRWTRPVGLAAVLLAASAEIEQYQRVRHDSSPDLHVVGHAVGDLVHLFAELLENATAFSRPDTIVRVTARAEGLGALVEIADQGLGMSPSGLAEANALLAEPPAADVAASERMGLFVVSHLGARHRIQIRLEGGEGGLVAQVRIPAELLAPAPAPELDAPASPRMLTTPIGAAIRPATPAAVPVTGLPASRRPTEVPVAGARPGAPTELPVAGRRPPVPTELPVAGRRPEPPAAPRQTRQLPVRAEDLLTPSAGPTGGGWFSRQGPSSSTLGVTPPPAETPVTGGTNERGLPVRVPMAQLAAVTRSARPDEPAARHEPDPDAVGGMLSRYYGGVRRAEAEETRELIMPPFGDRSEGVASSSAADRARRAVEVATGDEPA
ncbi:nitrate- and nitrite sensing domain-containing protein [Micromonospora sp. 4G57]|uniref:histidine kinase n=1 Tax=Micromonospora sicca TaxID=2202420 RepID=A0ABU5JHP7_9ACTN|nr:MULTISPECIES: nitrate- and nitrite sensing domain-containing protein [unclassified Micromonospora]MDZ5443945.1 nitrate- and nitrite sensing domain-containing protein [Micromonospora sp. 4G57]MDZ5491928.1 nitrate- and nitrite sensing domain-containing protein [Micromonospora sp. 4G53]